MTSPRILIIAGVASGVGKTTDLALLETAGAELIYWRTIYLTVQRGLEERRTYAKGGAGEPRQRG